MQRKNKLIRFDMKMEQDFEQVRGAFQNAFGVRPSNTEIQRILLDAFKANETKIQRKPRSKEWTFI